jgi:hypothetical protein
MCTTLNRQLANPFSLGYDVLAGHPFLVASMTVRRPPKVRVEETTSKPADARRGSKRLKDLAHEMEGMREGGNKRMSRDERDACRNE